MIYLHSANSQNLDILGNIENLARTRPVKMARMVTLVCPHTPYYVFFWSQVLIFYP